ncbi:Abi family protein [uncultured Anaerococcus sp.]|uniref:Abi family protein n=1 Tax=uncultured Anaerococcus sp. TaxID=293428 RepID=UPI0025DC3151|nr:Abi family protein [uncultured Anaerococcus sp.]
MNNIIPDKPFKDLNELLDILRSRNLIIEDEEKAKDILLTFSYYDLINGYKDLFMVNDTFKDGISLSYLNLFAMFDRTLQNTLFQYSVLVETSFKTALSYVISKKYGVFEEEYLNKDNYIRSNNSKTKKLLEEIKNIYKQPYRWMNQPTKHYRKTKNHIPPWILFKNISFDQSIKLYEILIPEDKKDVCKIMLDIDTDIEKQKELLQITLNLVRRFRNKIAHNLKFISYLDPTYSINKSLIKSSKYKKLFDKSSYNNVYSMIISLNILIKNTMIKSQLNSSIVILMDTFKSYNIIEYYCNKTGIPTDFKDKVKTINKAF